MSDRLKISAVDRLAMRMCRQMERPVPCDAIAAVFGCTRQRVQQLCAGIAPGVVDEPALRRLWVAEVGLVGPDDIIWSAALIEAAERLHDRMSEIARAAFAQATNQEHSR